jgi:hypothetical protein
MTHPTKAVITLALSAASNWAAYHGHGSYAPTPKHKQRKYRIFPYLGNSDIHISNGLLSAM